MRTGWTLGAAAVAGCLAWAVVARGAEPVADWTMEVGGGKIRNVGTAGSAGDLTATAGAALSGDVPTANTGGTALTLSPESATAAAESVDGFDPLAGAEAFTIMAWVRRESAARTENQSARVFSDIDSSGTVAAGAELRFAESWGRLALRINGAEVAGTTVEIPPDNGTWHHVAAVYDGRRLATNYATRNVHFYVDGVQRGHGNTLQGLAPASNTVPATVGNSSANRSSENLMAGSIDDVLVFAGWAPEPSGNKNLNLAIRDWMLLDDQGRGGGGGEEEGGEGGGGGESGDEGENEEEEPNKEIPPATLDDVIVQEIGPERNYEDLPLGLVFIDAGSGELYFADEGNPHGRAVCVCKGWPDWHNFTKTLRINGNRMQLNPHYSMQAESHTLTVRYGTNAVWAVLGDESGELAGITASFLDDTNLLVSANAVGPDVVLQVCTNLLEETPWKPATNAVVYSETDMATTWRCTLMPGVTLELYRVVAGRITRPAGVYAYEPLRAEKGVVIPEGQPLSMGTNTWTHLPNMETCSLYWPASYVTSNWDAETSTIGIPTNFPTRRLDLCVSDQGLSELTVNFNYWNPGRDVDIVLTEYRSGASPTNRNLRFVTSGSNEVWNIRATGNNYRITTLRFDSIVKVWTIRHWNAQSRHRTLSAVKDSVVADARPETVADWEALRLQATP